MLIRLQRGCLTRPNDNTSICRGIETTVDWPRCPNKGEEVTFGNAPAFLVGECYGIPEDPPPYEHTEDVEVIRVITTMNGDLTVILRRWEPNDPQQTLPLNWKWIS